MAAETFGFAPEMLRGSVIQAPLYSEDCGYAVHLPVEYRVRAALDTIEYAGKRGKTPGEIADMVEAAKPGPAKRFK